jgi:carboxyl-terminal processing protease
LLTSILHRGRTLPHLAAYAFLFWLLPSPAIAQLGGRPEDPRKEAAAAEKRGDWLGACLIYDELLRKDRNLADVREAYRRCLRQAHLNRRHRDSAYREAIARLTPDQAQALFVQVLHSVSTYYVDRDKLGGLAPLILHGVEELRFSLDDEAFVHDYLPDIPPAALEAFRNRLSNWEIKKPLTKYSEAKEQLASLARAAQACGIPNRPLLAVGIALECSAGVCNSLDEYSLLLSPGYLTDGSARSRPGSLGLDLGSMEGRVEVTRVYSHGAAAEAGILVHERITRVGDKFVEGLPAAEVAARLRGEAGTSVELEIHNPMRMESRVVKMVRHSVGVEYCIPSDMTDPEPIGYIRIPFFHENTLSEVQEALGQFTSDGVKGVVLDLRGNPGGLLKSALGVSELFLSEGVLAHSTSPYPEYNRSFRTELHNVCTLPLALLVDGDTASSAELLAGALKDHNRARVMGQTTYGKGSIQCLIPLDVPPQSGSSSIRLTVARFYSPTNQPYSGVGLTPHDLLEAEGEAPVQAARQYLAGLLRQMR